VGRARPTACDCGAVPVRAAGRATVGPKTVPIALPARPGWIGSAVGSQAGDADADDMVCPRDRRAALPRSPVPCHYALPENLQDFLGRFQEISLKFFRSCSEVARKLLGSFQAVSRQCTHRRAIFRFPLPCSADGGRRALPVGMSAWGIARVRLKRGASQVGRPGCKLDGFRKWEKSEVSPLVHTASRIGHNLGHVRGATGKVVRLQDTRR
jgi:hypothetical protein